MNKKYIFACCIAAFLGGTNATATTDEDELPEYDVSGFESDAHQLRISTNADKPLEVRYYLSNTVDDTDCTKKWRTYSRFTLDPDKERS